MINKVRETCSKIGYEYISGYEGSNCTIVIKCPNCKAELLRTWRAVRKIASGYQKSFVCENCLQIQKRKLQEELKEKQEQRKKEKEAFLIIQKEQREKKKEFDFWNQPFRQIEFTVCKNCEKPIIGRKYCSDKCFKAYYNKQKKDRRLRKIKSVNQSYIDIKKLYARDKGICYLCGEPCDFGDYTKRSNGVFIAGNRYPSIDHVIPLAKGGIHSWDNVKLSHRICNIKKRDKYCG